ncbi:CLUMA_CG003426, isoform A [Clunio marinus]|uniref:CLUMA_CG003426, isoform A n=1 Tax=Clunio marinus TaxID=568069 RepID=A0A1J1HTH3_9DIPT|nr:CLUMA_CG003426, isoform A [Clunio marinus]
MQDQTVLITICLALLVITQSSSTPLPLNSANSPPLCEPGIVEEMPPHIKKVCLALENSNQLSSALNQYIRNEATALMMRGEDLANPGGIAGKRTDVDHVFLRFGRR